MRLLFVVPALYAGGAERQVALLASGMSRRGHDVSLAYFYRENAANRALLDPDVKAICLEKRRGKIWNAKLFIDVVGLLRAGRFDAVQSFLAHANLIVRKAARITGTPALAGFRTRWAGSKPWLWTERRLAPWTVAAIGNSPGIVEEARRRFGVDKTYLLPNIIDFHRFVYRTRRIEGEVRLAVVARYVPGKNHVFAIRLVEALERRGISASLDCYGSVSDPDYLRWLEEVSRGAGIASRVRLHGQVDDVMTRLDKAHFLVFCSRLREGTPNAVLEALSSGLPVLLNDAFLDEPYSRFCIGLPLDDPSEANRRVERAIADYDSAEALALRARARRYVETEHSMEGVCARYESIVGEVLRG
jgi:glycosyltransferase involved in cell wall biosynthesis